VYSPSNPLYSPTDDLMFYTTPVYYPPTYVENITYRISKPLPSDIDLNQNPDVQKLVIKKYHSKTLEKWLQDELRDILNYLDVSGDAVKVVEYKSGRTDTDSDAIVQKKIAFIGDKVLTRTRMAKILYKFVSETSTNWYDLDRNEFYLRKTIMSKLKKLLKRKHG